MGHGTHVKSGRKDLNCPKSPVSFCDGKWGQLNSTEQLTLGFVQQTGAPHEAIYETRSVNRLLLSHIY
jgi:hypothetical protein